MARKVKHIETSEQGASFEEITSQLSPEAADIFLRAVQMIKDQPDSVKRNAKYADALTRFCDWCPFFANDTDWQKMKIVAFEDADDLKDAFSELLNLDFHISKRGRNGYTMDARLFTDHGHVMLESGRHIDFLNFTDSAEITPDDRIVLNTDWIFDCEEEQS